MDVLLLEIPELPKGLIYLYCSNCTQLRSLPVLPSGLLYFWCYGCTQLTSIPELPHSLKELACYKCTQLCSFPKLPSRLFNLYYWECIHLVSDDRRVLREINLSENMARMEEMRREAQMVLEKQRDDFHTFWMGQKDPASLVYKLPSDVFSINQKL